MALEVIKEKNNALFSRREITARVTGISATPSRKEVVDALCERFNTKPDVVVIEKVSQGFGGREAIVYAKIYSNADELKRFEQSYLLARGKPKVEEAKEKKEAPKPAEKEKPKPKSESKEGREAKEAK